MHLLQPSNASDPTSAYTDLLDYIFSDTTVFESKINFSNFVVVHPFPSLESLIKEDFHSSSVRFNFDNNLSQFQNADIFKMKINSSISFQSISSKQIASNENLDLIEQDTRGNVSNVELDIDKKEIDRLKIITSSSQPEVSPKSQSIPEASSRPSS